MEIYRRISRERNAVDWDRVNSVWDIIIPNNNERIRFPSFLSIIKSGFQSNPNLFVDKISKSHKLNGVIPENFNEKTDFDKSMIFFSFLPNILEFEQIERFVNNPCLGPERFSEFFNENQTLAFRTLIEIYWCILDELNIDTVNQYGPLISLAFGKLLIPRKNRMFLNTSFRLDYSCILPVLLSNNENSRIPSYLMVKPSGDIRIIKDEDNKSILASFKKDESFALRNDSLIIINSGENSIKLEFSDSKAANIGYSAIIASPSQGFSLFAFFLKCVPYVNMAPSLFSKRECSIPIEYKRCLEECIYKRESEMIIYCMMLPPNESIVKRDNVPILVNKVVDRFLPFFRASLYLNWSELKEGSLIFRQNNQLSFLCSTLLSTMFSHVSKGIVEKLLQVIEQNEHVVVKIPFEYSDAELFVNRIFLPATNIVFDSLLKMDPNLRCILRTVLIRTSSYYIDQRASMIILPNLILLRFVIPVIVEISGSRYVGDDRKLKICSIMYNSLLSLFYGNAWTIDKDPELFKFNEKMIQLYPKVLEVTQSLQIINEFDLDLTSIQIKQGLGLSLSQFFENSARRVSDLSKSNPNTSVNAKSILNSHYYCISLMQAVEEWAYNYS